MKAKKELAFIASVFEKYEYHDLKHVTRSSATTDRKCTSNMALLHDAKGISVWNHLGMDHECDKDVRTAAPSGESV